MISCKECQKKLVAVFDNEGCKGDEELINAHLKACSSCRAFREDMVRIRKCFASMVVPGSTKTLGNELMQSIRSDSLPVDNRRHTTESKHHPVLLRLPIVAWITGLAGLFLLIISWLACYTLVKEVSDLKGRLENSRQELAVIRQDLAVARATMQLKEDSEREQKAISALYFRMQELEDRFDQYSSPRTTFLPGQQNRRSNKSDGM